MSAWRRVLLAALALACSSSQEPAPEALAGSGGGGAASAGAGAGPGGAASTSDAGLAPTHAGGAGPSSAECANRRRQYFEEHGFLAAGTVRGLLEALDEPDGFWEQLPSCAGAP